MRALIITAIASIMLFGGFFNEEQEAIKQKIRENERICKLFMEKAEAYKKTMRNDVLAKTTLASYYHRAKLFCDHARDLNATLHEMQGR